MVLRSDYLKELSDWKDEKVIKVVTGMRRCGKSTLLTQFQDQLLEQGIRREQIISLNFEEMEYEELLDYKKLYAYLKERLNPDGKNYIFLDEIQRVDSYEKVVDSLYVKDNIDIYITGSNSYMLSGDLATLLSGRYVEIKMLPLSFREFCKEKKTGAEALPEYMKNSALPYVVSMEKPDEKINAYLEGIYNTVIVRDIEERQMRNVQVPGGRRITDIALLKSIAKYLAGVVGSSVSVKNITNYLISNGRRVSPNTVDSYISALTEAFVFYEAFRFDIAGKELLKGNRKFYIVDLGLRNYIFPRKSYDLGFSLENIVFLELMRRGYKTGVGKLGENEVDFVTQKGEEIVYYQVTADMTAQETFERELSPLRRIKDNYEKIVLTLDQYTTGNYEGIKVINAAEWLLNGK